MRNSVVLGLPALVLVLLGSASANALTIDAAISGYFTDTTLSVPLPFNESSGGHYDAIPDVGLAPGQVIVVDIAVSNPSKDAISEVSTTMTVQGDQIVSILDTVLPAEMLMAQGFNGQSMTNVNTGQVKGNSPNQLGSAGDVWIQVPSYTLATGTTGAGPDIVQLYMVLGAVGANDRISFDMGLTAGDSIAGAGSVNFVDATTGFMPEPGTAVLLGLGLAGLALRRDSP